MRKMKTSITQLDTRAARALHRGEGVSPLKKSTTPLERGTRGGTSTRPTTHSEDIDFHVGTSERARNRCREVCPDNEDINYTVGKRRSSSPSAGTCLTSEDIDYEPEIRDLCYWCRCWRMTMKTSTTPLKHASAFSIWSAFTGLNSKEIDYLVETRCGIAATTLCIGLDSEDIDYPVETVVGSCTRSGSPRVSTVKTSITPLKHIVSLDLSFYEREVSTVKTSIIPLKHLVDGVRGPGLGSLKSEGIGPPGKSVGRATQVNYRSGRLNSEDLRYAAENPRSVN